MDSSNIVSISAQTCSPSLSCPSRRYGAVIRSAGWSRDLLPAQPSCCSCHRENKQGSLQLCSAYNPYGGRFISLLSEISALSTTAGISRCPAMSNVSTGRRTCLLSAMVYTSPLLPFTIVSIYHELDNGSHDSLSC